MQDYKPEDDFEVEVDEFDDVLAPGRVVPEQKPEDDGIGELAIDVYEDRDALIIKAVTAGVRKTDLDIALTRESLIITGERVNTSHAGEGNYFHRELYWGKFTRSLQLPYEIDVDMAEAKQEEGLLTLKLPKLDKNRETRLKVQ